MFQATFSFTTQQGVTGLQVEAVSTAAQAPAVEITVRVKNSDDAPFTDVHVGKLSGYSVWSESPLALLLRSLHWLRVEWFSTIPQVLIASPIRNLNLSVLRLTRGGLCGPELASLSLQKTGYEDSYTLKQSSPNRALFPMEIDAWSAVPLGAALKAVAQVQLEAVDLHRFPDAPSLNVLTDGEGVEQIVLEQIPHYASSSFETYRARSKSDRHFDEVLAPARDWLDFLAA